MSLECSKAYEQLIVQSHNSVEYFQEIARSCTGVPKNVTPEFVPRFCNDKVTYPELNTMQGDRNSVLCRTYSARVTNGSPNVIENWYRNIHCAILDRKSDINNFTGGCLGRELNHDIDDGSLPIELFRFSLILDLQRYTQTSESCPEDFAVSSGACISPKLCTVGENETCLHQRQLAESVKYDYGDSSIPKMYHLAIKSPDRMKIEHSAIENHAKTDQIISK
jgi:hypothetical protein